MRTYFRHKARGCSGSLSAGPREAMSAKGQASSIMKAASNSRTGKSVSVMTAIWGDRLSLLRKHGHQGTSPLESCVEAAQGPDLDPPWPGCCGLPNSWARRAAAMSHPGSQAPCCPTFSLCQWGILSRGQQHFAPKPVPAGSPKLKPCMTRGHFHGTKLPSVKCQTCRYGAGKTRPQEDQGIQWLSRPRRSSGRSPAENVPPWVWFGVTPGRWVGVPWAGAGPAGEGGSGNDGHVGSAEWSSQGESGWTNDCHYNTSTSTYKVSLALHQPVLRWSVRNGPGKNDRTENI